MGLDGVVQELLALQALDTEADQLRHRLATLPERTEVDAANLAEANAAASLAVLDEQRHVLGRDLVGPGNPRERLIADG